MPQKAEESHEEYRARQQTTLTSRSPKALEERLAAVEDLVDRVIEACCRHHAGLCRDLEGPKTEEDKPE